MVSEHNDLSMVGEAPYIEERRVEIVKKYNPKYGNERECECGHPYGRHFDSYENMKNVGCKYCGCQDFKEGSATELMNMSSYLVMVKAKLPNSSGYHSSPSGDTDYETEYNAALKEVVPPGFEVIWPKMNHRWPVDSEGYTFVPLRPTSDEDRAIYWMNKAESLQKRLDEMVAGMLKLIG